MSQQLASAKSDGRPLDFGTITFDGAGNWMTVRRGSYYMEWTDFKASDVNITTVADDYALPAAPVVTKPRENYAPLNGAQFLVVVASALGFSRCDQLVASSPTIQGLLGNEATVVERSKGLTPLAITYLKSLQSNPLTDNELAAVDTVWSRM